MKTLRTETTVLQTHESSFTLQYTLMAYLVGSHTHFAVSVRNETTEEQAQVLDLTTDRHRATDFFAQIVRCAVTPTTLFEVAEDFVAQ